MKRRDFRFFHRLRVRWADVDPQGIVFNPNYLVYFDGAITEYYRAAALPYPEALDRIGGDLFVKKATVEYHAPAKYDEVIDVGVRTERVGTTSIVFRWSIFRGETLLVAGETVSVLADRATRTKAEVPESLRDALRAFDAGEPVVSFEVGPWENLRDDALALRDEVFVAELGVPLSIEHDALDAEALHVVARNRLGLPLATGRLTREPSGSTRIGRIAVMRTMRGIGLGRAVLEALVEAARARGDRELVLHARADAEPFYVRAGFGRDGEPYEEAGAPHVTMRRHLGAR